MLIILHASVRGIRDQGGQKLAEVEVHTADPGCPELLAYFRKGPKDYQLIRVLANEAQTDVDWFDNPLHRAFDDVTQKMFSGPSHASVNDRHEFAGQVLAASGVRKDLDLQFGNNGR
jgi:hypothetical protein